MEWKISVNAQSAWYHISASLVSIRGQGQVQEGNNIGKEPPKTF